MTYHKDGCTGLVVDEMGNEQPAQDHCTHELDNYGFPAFDDYEIPLRVKGHLALLFLDEDQSWHVAGILRSEYRRGAGMPDEVPGPEVLRDFLSGEADS